MSKIKESERLRAPLMYAFRSAAEAGDSKKKVDIREGGERVLAARRAIATSRRSLSDGALRSLLAEDLSNLLNTIDLHSAVPEIMEGLDRVRTSIVNYGLPDIANRTAGEVRTREMKIELRDSLLRYEPRLLKRGMEITESGDKEDGKISFLVRAEMRADPVPTSVEFVTDIEFDTGEIRITRL
jgi:type VI secretion system protein ImpF